MRRKKTKKLKGIYLWKLILILITIFAIFMSVECFLLIERTVRKWIGGTQLEQSSSISLEAKEKDDTDTEPSIDSTQEEILPDTVGEIDNIEQEDDTDQNTIDKDSNSNVDDKNSLTNENNSDKKNEVLENNSVQEVPIVNNATSMPQETVASNEGIATASDDVSPISVDDQDNIIVESLDLSDKDDKGNAVNSIESGTGNFTAKPADKDYEPGYDHSPNDNILRTFDVVTYNLRYTASVRSGNYTERKVYFEVILPCEEKEAMFEIEHMQWLTSVKNAKYEIATISDENIIKNLNISNKKEIQVFRGSFTIKNDDGATSFGETLKISIRALDMKNGDTFKPIFTFWLEHNDVGAEYNEDKTIPKTIVSESNYSCAIHGKEYKTLNAEKTKIKISAKQNYRIEVVTSEEGKCQQLGEYNFNTGNSLAQDKGKGEKSNGIVKGRSGAFGIIIKCVELYENQGLLGVEMPSGPIEFKIKLDSHTQKPDGSSGWTGWSKVWHNFPPLVWSFDENKDEDIVGGKQQDEREISTTTKMATPIPYNRYKGYEENKLLDSYKSCFNGGEWNITNLERHSEGYSICTVKVSNYEIDLKHLPYTAVNGDKADNKYYKPDRRDGNLPAKDKYWEVTNDDKSIKTTGAVISAGELWFIQPLYNLDKRTEESFLESMKLWNGWDYARFFVDLTVVEVPSDSNQTVTVLDKYGKEQFAYTTGQEIYMVNEGVLSQWVTYVKSKQSAWNDPLTDGCWYNGKDWISRGNDFQIEWALFHDKTEGKFLGVAYDFLVKFDDEFFVPFEVRLGGLASGETLSKKYLWAAKKDKKGWDHHNKSPDEDGYDEEMIQCDIDELIYFNSLDDLKDKGYTCVGVLVEIRGLNKAGQQHAHAFVRGYCKDDVEPGYVYMTTIAARAWVKDNISDQVKAMMNSESDEAYEKYAKENIPSREQADPAKIPEIIPYDNKYPPARWINGGEEGTSDISDAIRSYTKSKYDRNTGKYTADDAEDTGNYINLGDSCLVQGFGPNVSIKSAQTLDDNTEKTDYDMGQKQRVVDFVIYPEVKGIASQTDTKRTIIVTATLPSNLVYIKGTSHLGGKYTQDNNYQIPGNVEGSEKLTPKIELSDETGETLLTWEIEVGLDEFENITNSLSNQNYLKWVEPLYFSCTIGNPNDLTNDVVDKEIIQVTTTMRLKEEVDIGYENTKDWNRTAQKNITITDREDIAISNVEDSKVIDLGNPIGFTMVARSFNNNNTIVAITVPYNDYTGDIEITEFSVNMKSITDGKLKFYYTTSEIYKGKTSDSDELKNCNFADNENWIPMELSENENTEYGRPKKLFKNFPPKGKNEKIYAIIAVGNIPKGEKLNMHITYNLPQGKPKDVVKNILTQDTLTPVEAQSLIVNHTIEGLVWLDENKNGIREDNEDCVKDVKATLWKLKDDVDADVAVDEKNFEEYYVQVYSANGLIEVKTGYEVDVLTGKSTKLEADDAHYRFTNVSGGSTYAVKFESSSTTTDISKFRVTKSNYENDVGDTDENDSDVIYYDCQYIPSYKLNAAFILGIDTADTIKMNSDFATDEIKFNDCGFYFKEFKLPFTGGEGTSKFITIGLTICIIELLFGRKSLRKVRNKAFGRPIRRKKARISSRRKK